MAFFPHTAGSLEVICGSMFSGKSEELIRRVRLARIAHQRVQVFKPKLDTRYADEELVSHSNFRIAARKVATSGEIFAQTHELTDVVGIDEVQFFDAGVVDVCNRLANMGKRVIVAGLDQDYRGRPFDPMPQLMAVGEYVTKLLAVCSVCGAPSNRSQRLRGGTETIELGAADRYEARCRRHFEPEEDRQLELFTERELALKPPTRT
ncbi:MAG: thymidine kinase [Deltaproteobacteria bacterium]|nr:thymidine kinase [Deltaproteobacteria bacterium]